MPHILADRVLESSSSSGTGPFTMAGAVLGFRSFSSVCAVTDTVPYYIEAVDAQGRPTGDWEFGLGTYSAANQLTRTTIRGSSNGGLAVSFPAGTKLVGLAVTAPNSASTRAEWRAALGMTAIGSALATAADAAAAQSVLPVNQVRADVASAATVVVPTTTDHIQITGNTGPITGFTIAAGRTVFVRFTGTPVLTNNASIVTQTGANIAVQANDTCVLRATAANVVEVLYYTRGIPQALGDGQSWQDLTASRVAGTLYTNTTGRVIKFAVSGIITANLGTTNYFEVNGVVVGIVAGNGATANQHYAQAYEVPAGHTYRVLSVAGVSIQRWSELR